ncbi:glycosyltransferase [Candidatus Woesearchaeota archaeon]|nr:glycosyltransferase [Candidatus Woesearchaeota archaeon]
MISLVMPAYNESKIIKDSVSLIKKQMDSLKERWELIIIDDCSKDDTVKKLLQLKKKVPNLRVIRQSRNMGPGAAFRAGFKKAKGDVIITNDVDCSFSPRYIPKMLEALDNSDVVIGSQHMKGAKIINVPLMRVIASKTAVFLDRLILNVKLSTLTSFFVAYKRKVIRNIDFKANGFEAQCEILTTLFKEGYQIKEIPCKLQWILGRSNKVSIFDLFNDFKKRLLLWKRLRKKFKE